MSNFKKGQAVIVKSVRNDKIHTGKYVTTHPGAKGEFLEVALGDGKSIKARPSQVSAA